MKTSVVRIIAAAAALALLATACGGPGATDGEGEGELVWAVPAAFPELEDLADLWTEQNPDAPVRIEWLPEGADGQRQQLSLELNAGSELFDLMGIDVIWTGEFAENGWLEPLDDVREQVEGVLLDGPLESATWDGQLWALPVLSGAAMLYYRTDLVEEPPRTWTELRDVGLEVAEEEGIAAFVAQGAQYEGMVVNYLEYLWSGGGELFDPDSGTVRFGEGDAARQALEFMRDGLEDGLYAPGYNQMQEEDARNEFQFGNAVFMRNWVYAHALLSEEAESEVADRFGIAPLPTFDGDGTISAVGGLNNAVSAFSTRKEAAREFALFLTGEDVQRRLGEQYRHAPARADVYEQLQGDPVFDVLAEVMPESRARPPLPTWNEISVTMQQELYPAYNGERDLEAALQAVEEELEDSLDS
jgi:multiple sugar transport system substrate-binding protein